MTNLLLLSKNEFFVEDFIAQLNRYLPDFNVFREEATETIYDMILIDEEVDNVARFTSQSLPIFLLLKNGTEVAEEGVEIIYKPFCLVDMLEKLKSAVHLYENSEDGYLQFNNYELRPLLKEIVNCRNGEIIKLTEKEISILKYLYKASRDKIVSKSDLLQEVWGYSPDVTTHTIETHIYRLRQKVEHEDSQAQLILTNEGGYQLKF